MPPILDQIFELTLLSLVVASISWTVTQEEIFREPREWCSERSDSTSRIVVRKFFYVFTCEYCFSHWVTLGVIGVTSFQLVFPDWRGYLVGFFVTNWLANQWMSLYRRLRVDIKHENLLAKVVEQEKEENEAVRKVRSS